ncbi:MAG: lipid carrier--UDP-N-acetylgalactosaminyltransferase [Syntrophus sp. (in: bacteria)]|nr:lipid carrier--UDP-N-acetylgalactosaminyltransferase [Syntrophus sp. (in: bacteria)]
MQAGGKQSRKCVNPVYYKDNKRAFDLVSTVILLSVLAVPMLVIALLVKLTSQGPVLYWSDRIGKDNVTFKMHKFRTMRIDAPAVATHLLENPHKYLTPFGCFLRKFSLDELPQLRSVLKGDMSLVGPRPALYNQEDLILLRTEKGIYRLVPGITGWAQVNGRDNLSVYQKVEYDEFYMKNKSLLLDLKILYMTMFKVIKSEGVQH